MAQLIANRYQLGEKLGEGGMGVVYRVLDTQTGETVAIKQLKPELVATEPAIVERFSREAEVLRQLNHPNIVKVRETVIDGDVCFIVMEYVPGGSLYDVLKAKGKLSLDQCLSIALQLADALTRAHFLKIIHRDIKPGNVLLADDGSPRLTDFGIAYVQSKERLTDDGSALGTLDYMPPEALNGDLIDSRADIWAFGIMIYEMLVGRRPFHEGSFAAEIAAILTKPVPDLEVLRPDIPIALVDLIYRMLEKDRNHRISSIRLVGAELEVLLGRFVSGINDEVEVEESLLSFSPNTVILSIDSLARVDRLRYNFPRQSTPFVGREQECAALVKLLIKPNTRLVTILAPGGMGKTRLALEIADTMLDQRDIAVGPTTLSREMYFVDGVYFVELAPLTSSDFIISTIADALGFQFSPGGQPKQQLLDYLRGRSLLLVMDNFEHLLDGVGIVSEILAYTSHVKVLSTSRERLNLSNEVIFTLGGMDFPDKLTTDDVHDYSAAKLFLNNARRSYPDFEIRDADLPHFVRICKRVAGMPLGIVLIASWIDVLSLEDIAEEIEKNLDFLVSNFRDIPERQRNIRVVFEYSWNRLSDEERRIFQQLSVFRGGFTREAAQIVTNASLKILTSLVNKSLLLRDPDSGRYAIHELLRQFGEQQLSPDESIMVRDLHCVYYGNFFHRLYEDTKTPKMATALLTAKMDYENAQAAWTWAVQRAKWEQLWEMLVMLFGIMLWLQHRTQDALAMILPAVAQLGDTSSPFKDDELLSNLLAWQAAFSFYRILEAPEEMVKKYSELSLELLNRLDVFHMRGDTAIVLSLLGYFESFQGNTTQSEVIFQKALAICRRDGYQFELSWVLNNLIECYIITGEIDELEPLVNELSELAVKIGDPYTLGFSKIQIAEIAFLKEQYAEAEDFFLQAYDQLKTIDDWIGLNHVHLFLGRLALINKHYQESKSWLHRILTLYVQNGFLWMVPEALYCMIEVLMGVNEFEKAVELCQLLLTNSKTKGSSTDDNLKPFLDSLAIELPVDIYAAALQRGKFRNFDNMIQELLRDI